MRQVIAGFLLLSAVHAFAADDRPVYRFSREKPVRYSCSIEGTVGYGYTGARPEAMKVSVRTDVVLTTEKAAAGVYTIRCTPRKTVARLNGAVLEDISSSETLVSAMIPETRIRMRESGEIVGSEALSSGMLDISGMFRILPVFPAKGLVQGERWSQKLDALSFPGLPMAPLEFWYQYEGTTGETARFRIVASQFIREKRREKNIEVSFNGRNASSGRISFDRTAGEIARAEGDFDVDLKAIFAAPAAPDAKKSEAQSLPLTVAVKVTFVLSR